MIGIYSIVIRDMNKGWMTLEIVKIVDLHVVIDFVDTAKFNENNPRKS